VRGVLPAPNAHPFLKWVGGKRWLATRHDWLFPNTYNRYFEPFLGGGAVLFRLQPPSAYLSDANRDLISAYKAIKNDWKRILHLLKRHQAEHSYEYYYSIREIRCEDPVKEAARFIYLNRACFNGIYRVNRQGEFNVPKGSKETIVMTDDDFETTSRVLKRCRLVAQDFERAIALSAANDFRAPRTMTILSLA
jgi:DNA adenine methylase